MRLHAGRGAVDAFGPGPDPRYAWPMLVAGARATQRAQRLSFAALTPDPGQPALVAAWQAAIRAWLTRLVAAGQGQPRDLG